MAIVRQPLFGVEVSPPEADRDGAAIIFALNRKLLAAEIKSKNFIGEIQEREHRLNAMGMRDAVAGLGVHLGMGIEILITERPLNAEGSAVLVQVGKNVGIIVTESHARGERALIVRGVKVPVV